MSKILEKSEDNGNILLYALLLMSVTFSMRAENILVQTNVPLISKYYLNFNSIEIGAISAVIVGSAGIMSAFLNSKVCYKKRKKLFVSSIIVYSILEPLFYFSSDYTIWFLVIFSGFFFGAVMPNIISSASVIKNRRYRERVLTLYTLSLSASLVIAPLIESYILRYYNLYQLFLFFIPFGILSIILSLKIKFPEDSRNKKDKNINVFKNHGFRLSVFNNISYDIPFALILTFGGIFANDEFHAPYYFIEVLFAGFFGFSFVARGYLSYRPVKRLYITTSVSIITTIAGLILIYFSNSLMFYFIVISILGIPHGLTFPTSLTALSRSFNSSEISVANTYFYAVMMFIAVIVPSMAGLSVYLSNLRDTFLLFSIPVIILFFIMLYEYKKTPEINL